MTRRRWIALLVATVLVVGAIAIGYVRTRADACGAEKVAATDPLLSVKEMAEQPDERLDTLTAAVNGWGAPFGDVVAGVGYDYDQWLQLYGVPGGLLSWTKNNAPVTFLDEEDLEARWSLKPLRKRTAWDASPDRFLLLGLAAGEATDVAAYGLADGDRAWCVDLPNGHADGEPVATTFLDDGDVLVALPEAAGIRVARLSADDGGTVWSRAVGGADRADYLGPLTDDVFVMGGTEEYRLAEPDPAAPEGPVVTAYSSRDGKPVWSWDNAPGMTTHVVGVQAESTILMTRSAAGDRLRALDATGAELWEVAPVDGAFESTLRGDVVVMRSSKGLDGYDVGTGKALWHQAVPTGTTYFPYGFTLDQMPSLDETHVLMPTTSSLRILDVTTGEDAAYPLPTDGVSTTYWPYQLAATGKLIGIVTNTGGVVAHRE